MLKDDIRTSFNRARKSGDTAAKSALEAVIALITQKEKTEIGKVLTDSEVIECISKELKVQREISALYKNGSSEKQDAEKKIVVLTGFLPKQLSTEEVLAMIKELDIYPDASPRTKGMIIKELMPKIAGLFDRSLVSGLVESYLSEK